MMRSGLSSMALSMASAPSVRVLTLENWATACRSISRTMGLSSTSRTLILLGMEPISYAHCSPASAGNHRSCRPIYAPGQPRGFHALIQGLAHVINGKRGQRGSHQRLHLYAGWGGGDSSRVNLDAILAHLRTHINERERQRM